MLHWAKEQGYFFGYGFGFENQDAGYFFKNKNTINEFKGFTRRGPNFHIQAVVFYLFFFKKGDIKENRGGKERNKKQTLNLMVIMNIIINKIVVFVFVFFFLSILPELM